MAYSRRGRARKARRTYGSPVRNSRTRRSRTGARRRTPARRGGSARQQVVRVVIESGGTPPTSVPTALATIPGTQVTTGKRSRF